MIALLLIIVIAVWIPAHTAVEFAIDHFLNII